MLRSLRSLRPFNLLGLAVGQLACTGWISEPDPYAFDGANSDESVVAHGTAQ